jgi:2-iminoacetate synthase ThiH
MKNGKQLDKKKLIAKLKKFLKEKGESMIKAVGGASPRTYSYNDVKSEAFRMLREEINTMVSKPLSPQEEEKLQQVADAVTKQVLSELHV